MGLCKCSKKKVTNLFCFEHTVNVCEHCLVADHSKCVVQSYLHWLQDSDYDPTCRLCGKNLSDDSCGPCVRLVCYDLFHWTCLDNYQRSLPPTTAPAGYVCPICSKPIFPPQNIVGPVADTLRSQLATVNWARVGLGMPLIKDQMEHNVSSKLLEAHAPNGSANLPGISKTQINEPFYPSVPQSVITVDGAYPRGGERVEFLSDMSSDALNDPDIDKYKRRPALQWFLRWISLKNRCCSSTFGSNKGHRTTPSRSKSPLRYLMIIFIIAVAFVTIIMLFDRLGRWSTEDDPQFDPLANPNIRIEGD